MARKRLASPANDLLDTIAAVHATGLDPTGWPRALAAVAKTLGAKAATFEVFDRRAGRHRDFHSIGVPPTAELAYYEHHIVGNPRWMHAATERTGDLCWDYLFIDEKGMDHAPFYTELLAVIGLRYFVSGALLSTPHEFALVSLQFPARHGHVASAEIQLFEKLLPHFQQALDVARRLGGARDSTDRLERAFEWIDDGVAIISATGQMVYSNAAMHDILHRDDIVRLRNGTLEFLAAEARTKFDAALGAVRHLKAGRINYEKPTDFTVARAPDAPRCLVSVRPLAGHRNDRAAAPDGEALVFIRDGATRSRASAALLREAFGLTTPNAAWPRPCSHACRSKCTPGRTTSP